MCNHCAAARVRAHGFYDHWCDGCMARAVARSGAALKAFERDDYSELVRTIGDVFPASRVARARRLVEQWWANDHQEVTA